MIESAYDISRQEEVSEADEEAWWLRVEAALCEAFGRESIQHETASRKRRRAALRLVNLNPQSPNKSDEVSEHYRRLVSEQASYLKIVVSEIEDRDMDVEVPVGKSSGVVGKKVFVGHGRSSEWLVLEKFIKDRLRLEVVEFSSVPTAGMHTAERLKQMLDQSNIAFLVMTAEDERADSVRVARANVIHEVGLFQGRLGFERAIVLLEDGCEEFSNISGLGQIRFPRGNIAAVFEQVRATLEREGLLVALR
ncbi:TIR domain-containing protein [Corallococcus exercitus]|uniref:TIR domain-containing protein n=1 Tax=Corallococcus exercitus TaxID=2316736 RepID=UPI001C10A866|nr:TIR domain-containing protein [Corallococcus exercitus]